MPGQSVNDNSLFQNLSLGKPILSPIPIGPLEGVRTNNTVPPLAIILSMEALVLFKIPPIISSERGGMLLPISAKKDQMAVTLF